MNESNQNESYCDYHKNKLATIACYECQKNICNEDCKQNKNVNDKYVCIPCYSDTIIRNKNIILSKNYTYEFIIGSILCFIILLVMVLIFNGLAFTRQTIYQVALLIFCIGITAFMIWRYKRRNALKSIYEYKKIKKEFLNI